MEQLQNFIDPVSSFLWGWLLIYVLLATGLYFSIRTRLVQFRRFGHLWRLVFSSRGGAQGGISSTTLKKWNYMSSFGPAGTLGVAYEVPNLIQVPIEGTNQKKWVLLVGINPGAPLGGSATQYFIGDFDGRRFKADDAVNRWMEFGKDAYAMETYNDLPTQDVIAITWVGNWQYAQQVPTSPWRSAQSVARYLTLRQTASDGLILVQQPISLVGLHDRQLFQGSRQISDGAPLNISLQQNTSFEFETTVSADAQQQLNIDMRNRKAHLRQSAAISFRTM